MNKFAVLVATLATVVLTGCGTAKLYQGEESMGELAIIRGDLKVPAIDGGQVILQSVDGQSVNVNDNRATVAAGEHTVTITCRIPSQQTSSTNKVTFTAFAARVYKLELEKTGDSCRGHVVDLATDKRVGG